MGLFDLDCDYKSAEVVITPVPWDVTTSYGGGTSLAPNAIFKASEQIDAFSLNTSDDFIHAYYMRETSPEILNDSIRLKKAAKHVLEHDLNEESDNQLMIEINQASEDLNNWVYSQTKKTLKDGKIPACLGGDHSIPYGAIKAIAEHHGNNYSILHIDAHHDLRDSYQGFQHSHASIFFNVMSSDFKPRKLVQLGIRDFCKEEYLLAKNSSDIEVYYDREVSNTLSANEKSWDDLSKEICSKLSENVYISLDIDGLDPKLCPNTGTPVPGGIDFNPLCQLLQKLVKSSKKIIGFDLVEVSPGDNSNQSEWDANVGMRVLFELCKASSLSQK